MRFIVIIKRENILCACGLSVFRHLFDVATHKRAKEQARRAYRNKQNPAENARENVLQIMKVAEERNRLRRTRGEALCAP